MSNNKTVQAMHLGATLRKEDYEEVLEDLYWEVSERLEITEILDYIALMLDVVRVELEEA